MVPKNEKIKTFSENMFEVDQFRSGRGLIEAGKMDRGRARGGPSGTKNGHLWPKLWPKFDQNFGHHPGDPYHSGECVCVYI